MTDHILHFILAFSGVMVGATAKVMAERLINSACPRCAHRKHKRRY